MKVCKKPCHDCPWRKKSAKGWLGGQDPLIFKGMIDSGNLLPCHNTQDKTLSLEEIKQSKTVEHCAGALITMNNSFTLSRNEEISKLQNQFKQDSDFFKTINEFVQYNKSPFLTIDEFLETDSWEAFCSDVNEAEAEALYTRVSPKPKCKGCGDICDSLNSYYETYHGGIFSGNGYCIYCQEKI